MKLISKGSIVALSEQCHVSLPRPGVQKGIETHLNPGLKQGWNHRAEDKSLCPLPGQSTCQDLWVTGTKRRLYLSNGLNDCTGLKAWWQLRTSQIIKQTIKLRKECQYDVESPLESMIL